MKFVSILSLLILSNCCFAQQDINSNLDTSNYYNFYYQSGPKLKGTGVTTDWLRLNDIVPIIMEELEKAGHDWLYDRTLFKIDNSHYVVLAAYSRKSNFGFLYIEGHDMFPSVKHRKDMTDKALSGAEYVVCEETVSGKPNFVRINKLPLNVYPLNENNYWFQYTNAPEDDKQLVTKASASKILRMDIRRYLKLAGKPK
jgi:hypothetical protein